MSFPIVLYSNLSADNVLNKNIVEIKTLNGVLREGSSVVDPVIMLEEQISLIAPQCNYLYIQSFGRYYHIRDIVSQNMNLCSVHCHVDVLMSFKDNIKSQIAVVARQEGQYNMMLDDGFFMCYQNPKLQTKLFSVADPFETQEFVLVVAGSQPGTTTQETEQ